MNRAMNLIKVSVPAAALLLSVTSVQAFEFGSGEWSGSLDTTVSYGASWRANDLDPDNVGGRIELSREARAFSSWQVVGQ